MLVDRREDRRGLHEIRTCANNSKNLHSANLRPSHPATAPCHLDCAPPGRTENVVTPRSRPSAPRCHSKPRYVFAPALMAAPYALQGFWFANLGSARSG